MGDDIHDDTLGLGARRVPGVPAVMVGARFLFLLNAGFWTVSGVLSLMRLTDGTGVSPVVALVVATLMFANAGVMLLIGWALGMRRKPIYYLAITVLLVNIASTVTDEFGVLDLVTLWIDMLLLALLVVNRSRYIPPADYRPGV